MFGIGLKENMHSLVILAQSGRMLAQSAARAGWRPWVLDLYGDADTQACSAHCRVVADDCGGFARDLILAEVRLAVTQGAIGLVYGSGLECYPNLLAELATLLPVLGNQAHVVRRLKSPRQFFPLLDSLEIPYPETQFETPNSAEAWLVKPSCGEGGKGVAFLAFSTAIPCGAYFQRQITGTPMSVLFLADGHRACVVGFNELWVSGAAERPFGFVGANNRPALTLLSQQQWVDWLQRLMDRVALKGLNSLDFICNGNHCWALEINPRPSATLALYDDDFADGLLAAHVQACAGRLPEAVPVAAPRALRSVFAPQQITVPDGLEWPPCCVDLPLAGTVIKEGQPLCSVLVSGDDQNLMRLSLEQEQMALCCITSA